MTLLHHHRGPAPAHAGFDADVDSGGFPRELRYDEEEEVAASSEEEEEEGRRTIEFRIISAQELKKKVWHNLTMVGRMCTVAEAYVDADSPHNKNNNKNKNKKSRSRSRTRVDRCGGRNPVWNEVLRLSVRPEQLHRGSLTCLTIDVFCEGLLAHALLGSARIFLSDFVREEEGARHLCYNPIHCQAFWIRGPCGDPHGILNVWIPPSGRFLRRPFSLPDRHRPPPDPPRHALAPVRRATSLPSSGVEPSHHKP